MHPEVIEFLKSDRVQKIGWEGMSVLEIGAQDVNGRASDCFDGYTTWQGMDLVDGPGVTYVGNAADLLPDMATGSFDRAVSTEVLEHTGEWEEILVGMVGAVHVGGYLVITCASPVREPHGANGGPLPEGEYYRGVYLHEIVQVLERAGCDNIYGAHNPIPGDVQVIARRQM